MELVNAISAGTGSGDWPSSSSQLSADVPVVGFESRASNLDSLDTNSTLDVFV